MKVFKGLNCGANVGAFMTSKFTKFYLVGAAWIFELS